MFAYGIYIGYVCISSIRYQSPSLTTFLLTTGGNQTFLCSIRKDSLTNKWFKKHFDRSNNKFKGNLVVCQGTLSHFTSKKENVIYKGIQLDVHYISFLDFTSKGTNAIDNGKFYDRKILDWERYFSNDKFTK